MVRRLYRSKKNSIIGGVCGGIAEYFEIDPTLVRLLAILIVFLGGIGVVGYIIAWIIIPQNPEQADEEGKYYFHSDDEKGEHKNIWSGVILIFLGLFFLIRSIFPNFILTKFWPLILVIVGIGLIIQSLTHNK